MYSPVVKADQHKLFLWPECFAKEVYGKCTNSKFIFNYANKQVTFLKWTLSQRACHKKKPSANNRRA